MHCLFGCIESCCHSSEASGSFPSHGINFQESVRCIMQPGCVICFKLYECRRRERGGFPWNLFPQDNSSRFIKVQWWIIHATSPTFAAVSCLSFIAICTMGCLHKSSLQVTHYSCEQQNNLLSEWTLRFGIGTLWDKWMLS